MEKVSVFVVKLNNKLNIALFFIFPKNGVVTKKIFLLTLPMKKINLSKRCTDCRICRNIPKLTLVLVEEVFM